MGTTIESFVERVSSMPSIMYFHNLRFDGMFILDWLLNNGYEYVEKFPRNFEFTSLISNMGEFFSITVQWGNGKRTEFRDSYKKLPFKVSVIAEAFKLKEAKGVIDYHTPRPVGHKLTWQEREYLAADVLIVARAIKTQIDTGMTRLTVGSDALNEFKKTMGGAKLFERTFPILSDSMDAEIRKAYRGGFTYASPRFAGKVTRSGSTYDVNSLYPSVMYNSLLPYGMPVFAPGFPETTPERPLAIMSVTFTAKLKKDHIPCIQVKGSARFLATEYQTHIKEPVTLSCTNGELELWQDHYDMEILSYNGGWLFHAMEGVFGEYIDKWNAVKANSTGGMRVLAKLFLNSLYGKFASNPDKTGKVPVLGDGIVKLEMGPSNIGEPIYTAMGVFITAYARDITIRAAQKNYATFAYADTDSLHLLTDTDPDGLHVDPKELGAWKLEYRFDRALFIRAKTYTEHKNAQWCHDPVVCADTEHGDDCKHLCHAEGGHTAACDHETHIAGLPVKVTEAMTIEDFVGGRSFDGKMTPRRVPGGVILEDVPYTLPMW